MECWKSGKVPQAWKDAVLIPIFKKGDKTQCDNYRGISLLNHGGKILAKIIANRLSVFSEQEGLLPEEQCGFRRERSTYDALWVARLLQEAARAKNLPIMFAFVDIKKAYDTVNREALWVVLSKYGVPERLVKLIRAFHDDMHVRVRVKGQLSDEFVVHVGLRQGCVLAPILFNIYFAIIVEEANKRREKGGGIFIKYGLGGNPLNTTTRKEERKIVTKEIWNMLFADDAALVALSRERLQNMLVALWEAATAFGLTISIDKTKSLINVNGAKEEKGKKGGKKREVHTRATRALSLALNSVGIDQVESFVYLGGVLTESGSSEKDIARRKCLAAAAFRKYRASVFRRKGLSIRTKIQVLNAMVLSVLLYGAQTWTTTERDVSTLSSLHLSFLLQIMGRSRKHHISYLSLLQQTDSLCMEAKIRRMRLLWVGHVIRMNDTRLPKQMLCGELEMGSRSAGHPVKCYSSCIREDMVAFGMEQQGWTERATSAEVWKDNVEAGEAHFKQQWEGKRAEQSQQRATKAAGLVLLKK